MDKYSLSHLSDQDLLRGLVALVARDRATTAELVAHIAEVDDRKLFAPKGYSSMYEYCVRELHLSADAALMRIRAGRTARQFPVISAALADGRLHLTAVALLSPYLTVGNATELLLATEHRTIEEIKLVLAARFPQPELATRLEAIAFPGSPVASPRSERVESGSGVREMSHQLVSKRVESSFAWPKVAPLSAERYALQTTVGQSTHDKLRYAQALLGHAVPTGDLAEVLDRALDALIALLEKRKFGATSRPRPGRASDDPRHIPAHVKRAVWERDDGRCSFVGENGQGCGSRVRLEFDHVDPVARGGEATVEGIRLRCRAHDQYEAECVFGVGFMEQKREAARLAAAEARARESAARAAAAEARAQAAQEKREKAAEEARVAADEGDPERSVVPWLRQLGFAASEAREAAASCEHMRNAPLEERIKVALRHLGRRTVSHGRAAIRPGTAA